MEIKLFDSELKVMDILWKEGGTSAREIAEILKTQVGWSKTTTYTVIKKCIEKKAIERREPNFICHPLVSREQAREYETAGLINRMFDGAAGQLIASLIGNKKLSPQEIERLRQLVNDLK